MPPNPACRESMEAARHHWGRVHDFGRKALDATEPQVRRWYESITCAELHLFTEARRETDALLSRLRALRAAEKERFGVGSQERI